jgi:ribosomal-protein-alanine N-acetyltransferase
MQDFQPRPVHIRWMIRADMPEVEEIEQLMFEHPWSQDDFIRCLRQRQVIGLVAVDAGGDDVLGFCLYELFPNRLLLLNFAVHPSCQRRGVGRTMIEKLATKLSPQRRSRLDIMVRETNLDAQLFFRAMGFRATGMVKKPYDLQDNCDDDAIVMQYRLPVEAIA